MSSGRSRIIAYGIALRVLARRDGDVAEVLARGAVLVHVAVRPHADHVDRADQPPRRVQRLVVDAPARAPATTAATSREPRLRARWQTTTVARPLAIAAAACMIVAHEAPPPYEILSHQARLPHAEAARDRDLVGVLHLEHRHAVDVLGLEPGVVERQLDRLDRGVGDRPADVLGERQVADADDRHLVLDAPEEIAVEAVGHGIRLTRGAVGAQTSGAGARARGKVENHDGLPCL